MLGLHCFSLVEVGGGYSLAVMHRLLTAVHLLLLSTGSRAQGLQHVAWGLRSCGSQTLEYGLNSYSAQALLLDGMWDFP